MSRLPPPPAFGRWWPLWGRAATPRAPTATCRRRRGPNASVFIVSIMRLGPLPRPWQSGDLTTTAADGEGPGAEHGEEHRGQRAQRQDERVEQQAHQERLANFFKSTKAELGTK